MKFQPISGLLSWAKKVGDYLGPRLSRETVMEERLSQEKVRARINGLFGRLWILPYLDSHTGENQAMRDAYRLMLKEPAVKAALMDKCFAVGSLDLSFRAGSKEFNDKRAVEFCNYQARKIGGPLGIIESVIIEGLVDGWGLAEKEMSIEKRGDWKNKVVWQRLRSIDINTLAMEIDEYNNTTGIVARSFNGGEVFDPNLFVHFKHMSLWNNPSGMSDLRAAYRSFWLLDSAWKLRAIALEKYTMPMLKGTYSNITQKTSLETALENARGSTWVSIPQGAIVEAVELAQRSPAEFADAIKDLYHDIALGISGAWLQNIEGSVSDGRGDTRIHQGTADLRKWYVSAIVTRLINEQMVPDWIDLNFVNTRYPIAALGMVDDKAAKDMLFIDQGLQALGIPLSADDLYTRYGRPEPTSPEDALGKVKPGPGGLGGPGAGGPPGDGPGGPGDDSGPAGPGEPGAGEPLPFSEEEKGKELLSGMNKEEFSHGTKFADSSNGGRAWLDSNGRYYPVDDHIEFMRKQGSKAVAGEEDEDVYSWAWKNGWVRLSGPVKGQALYANAPNINPRQKKEITDLAQEQGYNEVRHDPSGYWSADRRGKTIWSTSDQMVEEFAADKSPEELKAEDDAYDKQAKVDKTERRLSAIRSMLTKGYRLLRVEPAATKDGYFLHFAKVGYKTTPVEEGDEWKGSQRIPEEQNLPEFWINQDDYDALQMTGDIPSIDPKATIKPEDRRHKVPYMSEEFVEEFEDDSFHWGTALVKSDIPHVMVIGNSGSGKSTVAMALASEVEGKLVILDPVWRPGNWGGLPCVTVQADGDYDDIDNAMKALLKEMEERGAQLQKGKTDFERLTIVFDEVPDAVSELKSVGLFIRRIAQRGRHSNMHLIGIGQSDRVGAWGLQGYGDAKENFATIYLGKKAYEKDEKLKGVKWAGVMDWQGEIKEIDLKEVRSKSQREISKSRLFKLKGVRYAGDREKAADEALSEKFAEWKIEPAEKLIEFLHSKTNFEFKMIGSVAYHGWSKHDLDLLRVGRFLWSGKDVDPSILQAMQEAGFEYVGQSVRSPDEPENEKYYPEGWSEMHHFQDGGGRKVEIWSMLTDPEAGENREMYLEGYKAAQAVEKIGADFYSKDEKEFRLQVDGHDLATGTREEMVDAAEEYEKEHEGKVHGLSEKRTYFSDMQPGEIINTPPMQFFIDNVLENPTDDTSWMALADYAAEHRVPAANLSNVLLDRIPFGYQYKILFDEMLYKYLGGDRGVWGKRGQKDFHPSLDWKFSEQSEHGVPEAWQTGVSSHRPEHPAIEGEIPLSASNTQFVEEFREVFEGWMKSNGQFEEVTDHATWMLDYVGEMEPELQESFERDEYEGDSTKLYDWAFHNGFVRVVGEMDTARTGFLWVEGYVSDRQKSVLIELAIEHKMNRIVQGETERTIWSAEDQMSEKFADPSTLEALVQAVVEDPSDETAWQAFRDVCIENRMTAQEAWNYLWVNPGLARETGQKLYQENDSSRPYEDWVIPMQDNRAKYLGEFPEDGHRTGELQGQFSEQDAEHNAILERCKDEPDQPQTFADSDVDKFMKGRGWLAVQSSNVAGAHYSPLYRTMTIEYLNGQRVMYWNMSPQEAWSFVQAPSKGVWIWDVIRVRGKGNSEKSRKPYKILRPAMFVEEMV